MGDARDMRDRLHQTVEFVVEIDKLKHILRQTVLPGELRRENDAEHSWHFATIAILLREYAKEEVDLLRVLKMILIHDIVEIDAGDTYAYDESGQKDKLERERKAADRLFGMLPDDLRSEMHELWDEFETMETPESKFAAALDRFQPLLLNHRSGGAAWKKHGINRDQVVRRNRHIEDGAPELWRYALEMIEDAEARGYLGRGSDGDGPGD